MADVTIPGIGPDASAGETSAAGRPMPRSAWRELGGMVPDVGRLLRALMGDPRVPLRAKVIAGAAVAYVALQVDPFPDVMSSAGHGVDDLLALTWGVRHLAGAAGFDVVRELWTGTDAGFGLLVVIAGIDA